MMQLCSIILVKGEYKRKKNLYFCVISEFGKLFITDNSLTGQGLNEILI